MPSKILTSQTHRVTQLVTFTVTFRWTTIQRCLDKTVTRLRSNRGYSEVNIMYSVHRLLYTCTHYPPGIHNAPLGGSDQE